MKHQNDPQSNLIAPDWRIIEATDADVHARNLRDWQQQYDQISDGPFYGRIDEVALEHLQVFREHTSRALRQQCNVWPNALWLGFAAGTEACRINGQTVTSDQLMCRPGGCEFELVTPEHFNIYGIVVGQQALLRTAEAQGIPFDARLWSAPRRNWNPQRLNALRIALQRLLAPQHSGLAGPLQQDMLLMAVLEVVQRESDARPPPGYVRRKAVVDRVKDYLEANRQAPVTITELCELTHVSRRTLQYSFESIVGTSPLRYLRLSRLNGVRRALSQPEELDEDVSVARIAARWGFWHAGQFAHDYKQLFGENPSETRRRTSGTPFADAAQAVGCTTGGASS
ncbi:transcriptional regulator, AraC family [Thiorhodococcus drewsii AZ1]|uniref:Transcriptional regulator, AraC family n=1 Tax=Thiorhodococcus drewsii AZ1 TaxID=765913 RepID=G2DX39_9GAMM|nr:helix-turn-helix domain-containing protein [Thiorhodococcus drewsii]EGV33393.1 transcriptional regulator, AraC family [Thiorhodococcus drewsii AZ1]